MVLKVFLQYPIGGSASIAETKRSGALKYSLLDFAIFPVVVLGKIHRHANGMSVFLCPN
jgi:hypothetical protein